VKVICRCRPLESCCSKDKARSREDERAVVAIDGSTLEVREPGSFAQPRKFVMDYVFGESTTTSDVFAALRGPARRAAYGSASAVLAYGPTGAGKTHTMYGDSADPGLVPRAASELLMHAGGLPVRVSMLELHNDLLVDLLLPPMSSVPSPPATRSAVERRPSPPPLEVRGGGCASMATIEGAREVAGTSVASILTTVRIGLARRQVAETRLNATSSRSHLIVVLAVGSGRLTLVDLAGVERVKRSGVEGTMLRQAQCINRSLQSLGDVIEALRRGSAHVPYRNSLLSRIVSGALGGGAETAVVVCITPTHECRDEAVTALCFAERLRRIPAASGNNPNATSRTVPAHRGDARSPSRSPGGQTKNQCVT